MPKDVKGDLKTLTDGINALKQKQAAFETKLGSQKTELEKKITKLEGQNKVSFENVDKKFINQGKQITTIKKDFAAQKIAQETKNQAIDK